MRDRSDSAGVGGSPAHGLGAATFSGDAILLIFAGQFLYFFAFEVRTGQTLGKRFMNVRVVGLDGSAVTMRMCAVRNVLRFIDALPLYYASGLLSLMRTGRARRQRIGDVAAGTTVAMAGDGRQLRTPRWLLPACAVIATLVSLTWIAVAFHAEQQSGPPDQTVATGFAGDSSQAPAVGTWQALGTVTSAQGDAGALPGQEMSRLWKIARVCRARSCSIWLTRQVAGAPSLTAVLSREADGWHARFPNRTYTCAQLGGQPVTGVLKSTWVLRFTANGTTAEAHERNLYTPGCGWGTDAVDWTAKLSQTP
ncbi:MAG: RDD family protein [Solirubrobacteraceae bacterium]